MKLLVKISLLYIFISALVLLLGATITYREMSREIEQEEKWFLEERLVSVVSYLERRKPDQPVVRDKMVITPLPARVPDTTPSFSDTLVTHVTLQRVEPHLKMDVIRNVSGTSYHIMLFDLLIEEDDIKDAVQEAMIMIYIILMVMSIVLSVVVSYFVFKPFQKTLQAIQSFSLKSGTTLALQHTSTSEFEKLNRFIGEMMDKARRDYLALKEFSENASHEMQTPIAIAQGKLELLMESPGLTEEQTELISSAHQSLRRLSRLGNALSLLTKIENREFSEFHSINLSVVLNDLLSDFQELVTLKSIQMEAAIAPDVQVNGNAALVEILLTNLLTNAIRHNFHGGQISICLKKSHFKISNTGKPLEDAPEKYFLRFKKNSDNPDSTGLGLSIVQRICDEHHFQVKYKAISEQHSLTVSW